MTHSFAAEGGPAASGIARAAFRALADGLEDCVFLTDRQGRFLAVNPSFARWVGQPAGAIIGRTGFEVWPLVLAEADLRADLRVLDGERVERDEQRPRGAETRAVHILRAPVRDEDGGVCAVLGVFSDRTGLRGPDAERRSAPLELIGRLAGGVAHDFNNMLTAVIGHLALLRETLPAHGAHLELLAAVERAATQASSLSQQLLALLRNEPRGPEPVDLNAVVEQVTGMLRRTLDARILMHVHLQPALPRVPAVAVQMTQLLLNLCLNARDAMPRGGRLWVETGSDAFDAQRARLHPLRRTGAFVRLRVADTGEGMPPAVRARLFEPLFTTKAPGRGAGLGLTIVQEVVQQHHGWVECVSTVGQGTCFDVYLPVVAATGEARPAASSLLTAS